MTTRVQAAFDIIKADANLGATKKHWEAVRDFSIQEHDELLQMIRVDPELSCYPDPRVLQ